MTSVASADVPATSRHALPARQAWVAGLVSAALALSSACAPRTGVVLPSAVSGSPDPEVVVQAAAARQACGAVSSYSAEIGVSGKIGSSRVRGRLLAGFADGGRARLEALAPFGQPIFILVTSGGRGTVLLPRDRKVVQDVPAAELLSALTGIAVDGADLAALLSGCVVRGGEATDGRQLAGGWTAATLDGGRATAFLRVVQAGAPPRIVAGQLQPAGDPTSALSVGYERFAADHLPRLVRLQRGGGNPIALELAISQVDAAAALEADAFRVTVPPEFTAVPLAEIRRAGPLAQER